MSYIPVGQGSGKVALNVGVHNWFEVLEFAVLQEVDYMDLGINRKDIMKKYSLTLKISFYATLFFPLEELSFNSLSYCIYSVSVCSSFSLKLHDE